MGRRTRLALLAIAVLLAGVFVATAAAIRFTDDSCANEQGCRPPTGIVDASYLHTVQISPGGGTAPYSYTVSNGALPPGLSLNSGNGQITGKPTTAGTYTFYINGQDACPDASQCIISTHPNPPCLPPDAPVVDGKCRYAGESTQRDFTITVDPRVLVTDQVPPPGTVGAAYSMTLVAVMKSGPDATSQPSSPLTWTVVGGQLPPGLALAGGGVISGTPTTAGQFAFTLKAALIDGRSDTKSQTITVRDALTAKGTGIAGARSEVSVPFSASLAATGGSGTFTWSLASGSLPPGVTLAPSGAISGTPRQAGRFTFTAAVADTEMRTANVNGLIVVSPRLTISTTLLRPGKAGRPYRAKLATNGGVIPKVWKVTQGPFPRGVRLDRKTGIISGLPRKAGVYKVTLQVTDGFKVTSTRTLRLTILP